MRLSKYHVTLVAATIAASLGAGSTARADTFTIHNGSATPISVGFAIYDPACPTGFRNVLWTNVGAHEAVPVDGIDVVNAFLITTIYFRNGSFETALNYDSLSNYIWDTPLTGSNDCATFRGPGDHFGYAVYNLDCNAMISHPGMVVRGASDEVPTAEVGCVNNISGPDGPPTECEKNPDLPECKPI